MTFAISMLNNILSLHTKIHKSHLQHSNALRQISYNVYILHLKICYVGKLLPPSKMIVQFICMARNLRLTIKYYRTKLSISRNLLTPQLPGAFRTSCYNFKSQTYNYSIDSQQAIISPKLETHTIILGWTRGGGSMAKFQKTTCEKIQGGLYSRHVIFTFFRYTIASSKCKFWNYI